MKCSQGTPGDHPTTRGRRAGRLAFVSLGLVALQLGPIRGVRVTHTLPPGDGVQNFTPDSSGTRVFYTVYSSGGQNQLYSTRSDGRGGEFPLTDAYTSFYLPYFTVSPDQQRLAYTSDHETPGRFELYSVRSDGSQPPVKLSPPLGPIGHVYPLQFRFTPDGARIVFLFNFRLYTTLADGSQPPAQLSSMTCGPGMWAITPASLVVFFTGEYHSMPADGSLPPTLLSTDPVNMQTTTPFKLSANGERLVYFARTYDFLGDGHYWILSVPVDGSSAPVVLFDPVPTLESSNPQPVVQITPDSQWVVHRSHPAGGLPRVVESAPIDGSSPAAPLHDPYGAGGALSANYRISPDGRVLFGLAPDGLTPLGLYVAPADHSAAALRLTPIPFPTPWKWEASSQDRVVLVAGSGSNREIYSVPIDGSAPPIRLNPPMVAGGSVYFVGNDEIPSFKLDPAGTGVLYAADQEVDEVWELYFVPINGSEPARKVNRPLPAGGDVSQFSYLFTPDGFRALYLADQVQDGVWEVFTSALHSPGRTRR